MAKLANPVEIHHPELGRTATVNARALGTWKAAGWKKGPLPNSKRKSAKGSTTKTKRKSAKGSTTKTKRKSAKGSTTKTKSKPPAGNKSEED